jgi:predicted transcriptional regulator
MPSIILSIHPKWVKKIFYGNKCLELRKKLPLRFDKGIAYLYATSPEKKIVGKAIVHEIKRNMRIHEDMFANPKYNPERVEDWIGMTEDEVFAYFQRDTMDYFVFLNVIKYDPPRPLPPGIKPPRNFVYYDGTI